MAARRAAKPTGATRFQLQAFLPYRLSLAANAVSKRIATTYAERFGVSIPEWRLLAVLSDCDDASQQDLVRATLMDKVAVSRAAQSLEVKGLIRRREDAEDGRARRLSLTRAGEALFTHIAPAARAEEARILAAFTGEEVKALHGLLQRLETAAR